jgi:hypothetical protein
MAPGNVSFKDQNYVFVQPHSHFISDYEPPFKCRINSTLVANPTSPFKLFHLDPMLHTLKYKRLFMWSVRLKSNRQKQLLKNINGSLIDPHTSHTSCAGSKARRQPSVWGGLNIFIAANWVGTALYRNRQEHSRAAGDHVNADGQKLAPVFIYRRVTERQHIFPVRTSHRVFILYRGKQNKLRF